MAVQLKQTPVLRQHQYLGLYEDERNCYRHENGLRAIVPITCDQKTQTLIFGDLQRAFSGKPTQRAFQMICVKVVYPVRLGEPKAADFAIQYDGPPQSVTLKE